MAATMVLNAFSGYVELMAGANLLFSFKEVRENATGWITSWFTKSEEAVRREECRQQLQSITASHVGLLDELEKNDKQWKDLLASAPARTDNIFKGSLVRQAFVAAGLFGVSLLFMTGLSVAVAGTPVLIRLNALLLGVYLFLLFFFGPDGESIDPMRTTVALVVAIMAISFIEYWWLFTTTSDPNDVLTNRAVVGSMTLLVTPFFLLFIRLVCLFHRLHTRAIELNNGWEPAYQKTVTANRSGI